MAVCGLIDSPGVKGRAALYQPKTVVGADVEEAAATALLLGDVYQGSHAWIMCLYALREYRQ